ncbi:glycerol-1-phosphate dehydrogenase [NAD(P)+] [Paenibacillus sp. DS2015]|uniref:sn-glycerol-1-phosphate dehydrogenase n=1 Tax=Paenibacillus sp. DS2015 TaxID=3373917 RepID=UPI003D1AC027
MQELIARWNEQAKECLCGNSHKEVHLTDIVIEEGALFKVAPYLLSKSYQQVTIVEDAHTAEAAGNTVEKSIKASGIMVDQILLTENAVGDVIADESYIAQVLIGVSQSSEAVIAVGSGTIHDLVRFVCFKMNKPFISVPTAASVDGFTSAGAPLIVQGVKTTFQAVPPAALFADLDILVAAPQVMTAAGFGDMLGKYTSLADWRLSKAMADEPFCPLAYDMTEEALMQCVENVEEIAACTKDGLRILMTALVASGISMLIIDHSRPASGGEHHISHRWEMEFIEKGRKQVLHGAKVGVASALLADIYRHLAVTEENENFKVYAELPTSSQMRHWLQQVGGPTTIQDLGVSEELLALALQTAHTLRDRYTGLKYMSQKTNER